jgi:carbon-monoxide dehydrogenase small subunit
MKHPVCLSVNGKRYEIYLESRRTLLQVIREDLGLTGTKKGCEHGECGACSVIIDGKLMDSCLVLAIEAAGKEILTIEGLRQGEALHPLQESFIQHAALQCGFCTPGMILAAKALLDKNPHPTEKQIRKGLEGNLCRCTGYNKIVQAIMAVARSGGRNSISVLNRPEISEKE